MDIKDLTKKTATYICGTTQELSEQSDFNDNAFGIESAVSMVALCGGLLADIDPITLSGAMLAVDYVPRLMGKIPENGRSHDRPGIIGKWRENFSKPNYN